MILIDHQVGTNTWAASTPLALLHRNVVILAKFAQGTGMPLVLTSSQETSTHVQGPSMQVLEAIAPASVCRAHPANRSGQCLVGRGLCQCLPCHGQTQLRDGWRDDRCLHGCARDQRG